MKERRGRGSRDGRDHQSRRSFVKGAGLAALHAILTSRHTQGVAIGVTGNALYNLIVRLCRADGVREDPLASMLIQLFGLFRDGDFDGMRDSAERMHSITEQIHAMEKVDVAYYLRSLNNLCVAASMQGCFSEAHALGLAAWDVARKNPDVGDLRMAIVAGNLGHAEYHCVDFANRRRQLRRVSDPGSSRRLTARDFLRYRIHDSSIEAPEAKGWMQTHAGPQSLEIPTFFPARAVEARLEMHRHYTGHRSSADESRRTSLVLLHQESATNRYAIGCAVMACWLARTPEERAFALRRLDRLMETPMPELKRVHMLPLHRFSIDLLEGRNASELDFYEQAVAASGRRYLLAGLADVENFLRGSGEFQAMYARSLASAYVNLLEDYGDDASIALSRLRRVA